MLFRRSRNETEASRTKSTGALGEALAADYLSSIGYQLVCRNWRISSGELDLVAWDSCELVFIEVKTRKASLYSEAHLLDSITATKRRKLRRLAELFLLWNFRDAKYPSYRIDVIGLVVSGGAISSLRHLKGAM
ncbi:UNVERIFIED_CONTAM: hypothetical protein GTU68_036313 [Idotea baltica]|nr:hypothetical protein [Idotea baltica]